MKRLAPQLAAFIGAGAITAVCWHFLTKPPSVVTASPAVAPARAERQARDPSRVLAKCLARLARARTADERLRAAAGMRELPVAAIPGLLDQAQQEQDRTLCLAGRLLLVRWAEEDGPGACLWAWEHRLRRGDWDVAFGEIAASWAWRDPPSLVRWTREIATRHPPVHGHDTIATNGFNESMVLSRDNLKKVALAVVSTLPREAFDLNKLCVGMTIPDIPLHEHLHTVTAVREALGAFEPLGRLRPDIIDGSDMPAFDLLRRWKELDPEDFARSGYAHLVDIQTRPPPPIPAGPLGWVREYEDWRKSEPRQQPDTSTWSAAKARAWRDLESLMPPDAAFVR